MSPRVTRPMSRQAGEELMEYIYNENNKDLPHFVGKDPRNRYFKK